MATRRTPLAAVLAASLLATAPTDAQNPVAAPPLLETPRSGPAVRLIADLSFEMGGDRVQGEFFEDGPHMTMVAGQGGTVAAGLEVRPHARSPFAVRATAGYKYVGGGQVGTDLVLTRVPIEVVGTYRFRHGLFVGAGYVRHERIRFRGDDGVPDLDFKPAQGATFEAGWRAVSLTYTRMDYEDVNGKRYDASVGGLSLRAGIRIR